MSGDAGLPSDDVSSFRVPRWRFRSGAARTLHLVDPTPEELTRVGGALGLDYGVVRQLQNPELVSGAVQVDGKLLMRLDVPVYSPDKPLEWKRVDLIIGPRLAVSISPEGTDLVKRGLDRWHSDGRPDTSGTLLAVTTAEALDSIDATLERFESHKEHLTSTGEGGEPLGAGESLERLIEQLDALQEKLSDLCAVLDRFENWHPAPLTEAERAEMLGVRDRARGIHKHALRMLEELKELSDEISGSEGVLDVESPRIVEIAASVGERRLVRMTPAHAISGIIGGMAVSFGSAAMSMVAGPLWHTAGPEKAHLIASVAFPIGFLILVIGRGELFTENFFVPVTSVWMKRAKVHDLALLWGTTLLFNLVGAFVFAWVISRHGVLHPGQIEFLQHLAEQKGHTPHLPMFWQSLMAGWVVTLMTWLMLATKGQGPRMVMVWCMGFLIAAGHFNHVVVSAADIFMGKLVGADVTVKEWLWNNFVICAFGNLVGGILFVTIAGYLQAHAMNAGEAREPPPVKEQPAPRLPPRGAVEA